MKQVLQSRSGLTVVRDVPVPAVSPGSLLVRNAFSVISSGTERARVLAARKSLLDRARERPDLVKTVVRRALAEGVASTREAVQRKLAEETAVGYSSAGRVLEVGSAVVGFDPGDTVACAGVEYANHAELVSVPANLCAKVPDGVSLEAASLTTVAAIALHSMRLAAVDIGDRVAVIGCGLVGQILCRLLRSAGAEVFALDIDTARLEDAHRAGADHVFLSQAGVHRKVIDATGGIGVDAAITAAAAPSNDPLLLAAQLARDRGVIVLVGDVPVDLPREPLYRKELLLRVSRSYGPGRYDREYEERGLDYPIGYVRWTERRNMESILALQARGLLELGDLIDEVFPVEAAPAAYERLAAPAEDRPRGALLLSYPAEPEAVIAAAPVAEARPRRPRQAHEPVRIGLIGPGRFARTVMIPAFAAAGAKLELVGGGAGPSAEAARRDFGFDRVAARERAVIEDDRVDAVVICTRHASHASLVVRALDAGKHVFCEKPLALSLQELEGVLAAASRSDGILAVGFNRRYSPLVARLRQVFEGRASPLVVTYRIAAGRVAADHWQHDPAEGGGRVLGEVGHFVDTVTYVTGSPVVQVHALAQSDAEKPIQARDDVSATLLLEDGSVATIAYIADVGPGVPKERVEVHGSSRSAVLEDFRELDVYEAGRRDRQRSRVQRKGHAEEIEAFLDGVRRGDYPVPLESIENVTLATIAIVESIRTARPVELGPVPRLQEHRAPPSRH